MVDHTSSKNQIQILCRLLRSYSALYEYGVFECCNCEPLSESDYESESDSSQDDRTYVPDSD